LLERILSFFQNSKSVGPLKVCLIKNQFIPTATQPYVT
jgi:hypothetical protein